MILDLRSQQVRDTCLLLENLSLTCKDHLRILLREVLATILDALKVPNKVMSGYVHSCVLHIIKNTTFKGGISVILNDIKENKSKVVREYCLVSYIT